MRYLKSGWSKILEAVLASMITASSIGFAMIILLGTGVTVHQQYPQPLQQQQRPKPLSVVTIPASMLTRTNNSVTIIIPGGYSGAAHVLKGTTSIPGRTVKMAPVKSQSQSQSGPNFPNQQQIPFPQQYQQQQPMRLMVRPQYPQMLNTTNLTSIPPGMQQQQQQFNRALVPAPQISLAIAIVLKRKRLNIRLVITTAVVQYTWSNTEESISQ